MLARNSRPLALLVPAVLAVLLVTAAHAQGGIEKRPVGPGIQINPMNQMITAQVGELITWEVTITNSFSPGPVYEDFWDTPQDDECAGGDSRFYVGGGLNGGTTESAPQTAISFPDPNGDGSCDEAVLDAAGGAVECDVATQTLVIRNAAVPGFVPGMPPPSVTIRFLTYLDERTPPGSIMCNWAQIFDDKEDADPSNDELLQPTSHPGRRTFGCTCMTAAPPNDFDFEATKTAAPDTLPLVPNAPDATILYTITGRNTGGTDIPGATMSDVLPPGLEWVGIVDCPAPLACRITGNTLNVSGYVLPTADPDVEVTVTARAHVTCGAATDDDTGKVCNQAQFSVMGGSFPTDDPSAPGIQDQTCVNVVFSNLTDSRKEILGYDDNDRDNLLSAGDTVHFRIRARNTGRLTARDVIVTDDQIDAACFDLSSLVVLDGGTFTPGPPPRITWNVGDIAPTFGEVPVRFDVNLAGNGICCNQAHVNSAERRECRMAALATDDPTTTLTANDPTCALPGPRPSLTVTKVSALEVDEDSDGGFSPGDIISFTIAVRNGGSGTATGAQLVDSLSPCLSRFLNNLPDNFPTSRLYPNEHSTTDGTDWGADSSVPFGGAFNPGRVVIDGVGGANGLIPGETVTVKFYVRLEALARCCNQAFVSYDQAVEATPSDDLRTPGLVNDPTCFNTPPAGPQAIFDKDVQVFDVDGDGYLGVGDRATYTITLTSSGTSDLNGVIVRDLADACYAVRPGSVVISPAGVATDASSGNDVIVNVTAPMAPSDSVSITFDVDLLTEGRCCNQASLTTNEIGRQPSNDPRDFIVQNGTCVNVVQPPRPTFDLGLTKSVAESGCLDPGASVHFTLHVANRGTATVTTWRVEDILPAGFTGIVVDPPLTLTGSTVSLDGPALAPGESVDLTYVANVPCAPDAGTLTNTATLTYDASGLMRSDTGSTSVTWGTPKLGTSTKMAAYADANGNGCLDTGELVTFTITVVNTGSCDARELVVTDVLDAELDPAGVVVGSGGTLSGSTVTWDGVGTPALAALAPGASVVLTVAAPVGAAGGVVDNTADIVATGNAPNGCSTSSPGAQPASGSLDVGCRLPATQDLLRNAEVTSLAGAPAQMRALVFGAPTPNVTTCGLTKLDPATDTRLVDVGVTLAAGVPLAGDGAPGGSPLVFYEITERCQPVEEGGTDPLICVRKAGTDVVVHDCP